MTWASLAFTAILGFFLSPFIVHHLGDQQYGVWALIGSVTRYMWLMDLGVRGAVTRYVARNHAKLDHNEAGAYISAALATFSGLACLVLMVGFVLSFLIGNLFSLPPQLVPAARAGLILVSIDIGLNLFTGVYGGVLEALQRYDLLATNTIIGEIIRAAGLVLVLRSGWGIVGVALAALASTAYQIAGQRFLSYRVYPELRISLRRADRGHVRSIITFSSIAMFLHLSNAVISWADPVIIGAFLPVTMITFFAIGSALLTYVQPFSNAVLQMVGPPTAAAQALGETDRVQRILLQSGRLSSLIVLPVTITLMIRGGSFLGLWMGQQYAALSGRVLLILAISLSFSAPRRIIQTTFISLARHRHLAPYYVSEMLINLALSIYLVQVFGIIGDAWGTTIPSVAFSCAVVPLVTQRIIGIPVTQIWLAFWIRPALSMLPFTAGTAAVELFWPAGTLVEFFLQVALVLPFAALGGWYIALRPEERKRLSDAYLRPLQAAFSRTP